MPLLPFDMEGENTATPRSAREPSEIEEETLERQRAQRIRVKNRRKTYLDQNPEYFSPSLELADPLLYDRLIRRFQSAAEREAEGRQKGYSGVLEADLMRSEAKLEALAHPERSAVAYRRGAQGEIYVEELPDAPQSKEEGRRRWRREMTERFLRGDDDDFDYHTVDESETWDDRRQEERDEEEKWFTEEEPRWILDDDDDEKGKDGDDDDDNDDNNNNNNNNGDEAKGERVRRAAEGETGIQDF